MDLAHKIMLVDFLTGVLIVGGVVIFAVLLLGIWRGWRAWWDTK